jgi:hypothetical protein
MANMLRKFELEERDVDPNNPWGEFTQVCAFGITKPHLDNYSLVEM